MVGPQLLDSVGGLSVIDLLAACPLLLAEQADPGPGGLFQMLPVLALIMLLFYFMVIRPERNKQKVHQAQISALKKNDRIVTVGGIYGVVTNVQRDADEVTIKVDESTNTKLRITVGAVARVLSDRTENEKPASS